MVEINNQRKAFLDMLAWSEELITDAETRNHGYDAIVGGELFTDYSDHPLQICHVKPKTQSTGAGRYQLLSRLVGCPMYSLPERLSSESWCDAVVLQGD